jgi:hypothetical protein
MVSGCGLLSYIIFLNVPIRVVKNRSIQCYRFITMVCHLWKHSVFGLHSSSTVQNRIRNNVRRYDVVPEQSLCFE